jgi:transcriptional regulator with XRE-family HTH domain
MNKIKTIRNNKGLTQSKLAEKIGVTQGALSQWELGIVNPSINNLRNIAIVLNCSLDELFDKKNELEQEHQEAG